MPDQDIDDLIKQWLIATNENNSKNILAEKIGEYYAKITAVERYANNKGFITIPTRGRDGAPILDVALELDDKGIASIEAKFNKSQLARVNKVVFAASEEGEVVVLTLKGAGRQLDGYWHQDRFREIRKTNKRLANKLSRAWSDGKLKVLKIQTIPNTETGKFVIKVTETTSELYDFKRGLNRQLDDKALVSGREARKWNLANPDYTKSEQRANKYRKIADQSENKAKQLEEKVIKLQEKVTKLQEMPTSVKRKITVGKYQKEAEDAELAAKKARSTAIESEKAALRAETALAEEVKLMGAGNSAGTALRVETALAKEVKLMGAGNPVILEVEKATTASRLTSNTGTAARVIKPTSLTQKSLPAISKVAKLKNTYKVLIPYGGHFINLLKVLNVVGDFLMILDGVTWVVNWFYDRKHPNIEEWKRISFFVFGTDFEIKGGQTFNVPFIKTKRGIDYKHCWGDTIPFEINRILAGGKPHQNFPSWLNKWRREEKWSGFVYIKISTTLERQENVNRDQDEAYRIKYYRFKDWDFNFTDVCLQKNDKIKSINEVALPEADARNLSTNGNYRSMEYDVIKTDVEIEYTLPSPILTPFHFVIFKCEDLMVEMMQFISLYDPQVLILNPFEEITEDGANIYWYENISFTPEPHSKGIHFCLKKLRQIIKVLMDSYPQEGDQVRKDTSNYYNVGHLRRIKILHKVLAPNRNVGLINELLKGITVYLNIHDKYLIKPINAELTYLTTQYLYDIAYIVKSDLVRIYKNMTSDKKEVSVYYEYRSQDTGFYL